MGGPSSLLKELSILASLTLTSPPGLRAAPSPVGPDSAVPAIPVSSLQLVPSPAAPGTLPQPPRTSGNSEPGADRAPTLSSAGRRSGRRWCRFHDSPCPSSIPSAARALEAAASRIEPVLLRGHPRPSARGGQLCGPRTNRKGEQLPVCLGLGFSWHADLAVLKPRKSQANRDQVNSLADGKAVYTRAAGGRVSSGQQGAGSGWAAGQDDGHWAEPSQRAGTPG